MDATQRHKRMLFPNSNFVIIHARHCFWREWQRNDQWFLCMTQVHLHIYRSIWAYCWLSIISRFDSVVRASPHVCSVFDRSLRLVRIECWNREHDLSESSLLMWLLLLLFVVGIVAKFRILSGTQKLYAHTQETQKKLFRHLHSGDSRLSRGPPSRRRGRWEGTAHNSIHSVCEISLEKYHWASLCIRRSTVTSYVMALSRHLGWHKAVVCIGSGAGYICKMSLRRRCCGFDRGIFRGQCEWVFFVGVVDSYLKI